MKWLLLGVIVAATTVGEVLQAMGMKQHGEIRDFRPDAIGQLLGLLVKNKLIIASVGCMAVSFFAFMALLSVAEMSFSVPATAATYVPETAMAKVILKEKIGLSRWIGALLVAGGVMLLSC